VKSRCVCPKTRELLRSRFDSGDVIFHSNKATIVGVAREVVSIGVKTVSVS
jgi:hypothetical protein